MPQIPNNAYNADEVTYQTYFYNRLLGGEENVHIDRSTDGYIDGMIFEHKTNVTSYGSAKALSQALIYLTRFNRDGIPVPGKIMLVSQEEKKAYLYDSQDYIDIINNIPVYANIQASQGINDFHELYDPYTIDFDLENVAACRELLSIVQAEPTYVKVDINEHNVYGWSEYYYRHSSTPKKIKFFNELRNPRSVLAEYINPWNGEEEDFSLIMDLLNDPSQKKKLGAYYTPPEYSRMAIELVKEAIAQVPEGNDYIILDRCAGTGSLEYELTEEELSHVVVNTYELKEWHALKDRLGNMVRCIIPPIPANDDEYPNYDDNTGFLNGSDALSEDFLCREEIMQYVNNPNCNIILFENPPFSDDAADTPSTGVSRGTTANSFMAEQFNQEVRSDFAGLILSKDVVNLFIWSGFKYYLRKPNDAYILFSPVKCWKTGHFINKKFVRGYLFNRDFFHATSSGVTCIYWQNIDDTQDELLLEAFNIADGSVYKEKDVVIKKITKAPSELFDRRVFEDDVENGIWCSRDGNSAPRQPSTSTRNVYNDNIIGWVHLVGMAFNSKNVGLVRCALNLRKNGFFLRKDNFEKKLPLFCAKSYPHEKWYDTEVIFTSADKGTEYEDDMQFLKKCLIWTCLTQKNHCLCIDNSDDGRYYKNELCFDNDTLAYEKLSDYADLITADENNLINKYRDILREIKKTSRDGRQKYEEYNPDFSYGLYQITKDIDVEIEVGRKRNGKIIKGPKYGNLHNKIEVFKKEVQNYYNQEIVPDLFKYELLK